MYDQQLKPDLDTLQYSLIITVLSISLIFLYISKISLFVCNGFLPHVFGEIDGHIVLVFQLVCLIQKEMVIYLFEFDACQFL